MYVYIPVSPVFWLIICPVFTIQMRLEADFIADLESAAICEMNELNASDQIKQEIVDTASYDPIMHKVLRAGMPMAVFQCAPHSSVHASVQRQPYSSPILVKRL